MLPRQATARRSERVERSVHLAHRKFAENRTSQGCDLISVWQRELPVHVLAHG